MSAPETAWGGRPAYADAVGSALRGPRDGLGGGPRVAHSAPEFAAFRQLYGQGYVRYAQARLGDAAAGAQVVDAVFDELASRWPEVLCSPCPGALVWQMLRGRVARVQGEAVFCGGGAAWAAVEGVLPAVQADAVVLRCWLQMTATAAAELMGIDVPALASAVRAAGRFLPADVTLTQSQ